MTPEKSLTEEQRKKKMRLHVPCAVVGGCASLVLLILAIVALVKISNFTGAFTDILDTWHMQPVYDVQFVSVDFRANGAPLTPCPTGYSFKSGEWKGTNPACTCFGAAAPNSTDSTACSPSNGQPAGVCSNGIATSGCCPRAGLPAVKVSVAGNLGLCILRAGADALSRPALLDKTAGTCPSGAIRCGSGSKNWYCVQPPTGFAAKCPVTDLAIVPADVDVTPYALLEKRSLGLIDGEAHFLYLSRGDMVPPSIQPLNIRSPLSQNVTTYPLTDLWIQSGRPCLIESSCFYSGRSSEYSAQQSAAKAIFPTQGYSLAAGLTPCAGCIKPPKVEGGSVAPGGEDIRYVSVFSRPEWKAFNDSGVPSVFQSSGGGASSSSGYEFSMQARSEVAWSNTCAKSREDIDGQKGNVSHVRNFQIVLLIVSIFTFLIFSIAIPVAEYKSQGKWSENRRNWYLKIFLNVGFKCFVIAFTLATMIIALAVLAYWVEVDGSNPTSSCADPLSTEVFKILSTDYRSLSYSNVGSVVTMGFTGFLDGIGKLLWVCGK